VDICTKIRPGFLTESLLAKSKELAYLEDEQLLIKSIDSKAIETWDDFEVVLTLIVENRILKVFVTH
jgi:hypothetical protein